MRHRSQNKKQINDPVKLQQRIDKIKKTIEIINYKIRKGMYENGQECDDLFYHVKHEERELQKFEKRLKEVNNNE